MMRVQKVVSDLFSFSEFIQTPKSPRTTIFAFILFSRTSMNCEELNEAIERLIQACDGTFKTDGSEGQTLQKVSLSLGKGKRARTEPRADLFLLRCSS